MAVELLISGADGHHVDFVPLLEELTAITIHMSSAVTCCISRRHRAFSVESGIIRVVRCVLRLLKNIVW